MSKIDLGILIFGIFLVVIGWNKGFLRTLSGPLALALSIALGNKYFNDTQDMMKSALIFLFGPLVIGVAFWFLLNLIRGASGKEAPPWGMIPPVGG